MTIPKMRTCLIANFGLSILFLCSPLIPAFVTVPTVDSAKTTETETRSKSKSEGEKASIDIRVIPGFENPETISENALPIISNSAEHDIAVSTGQTGRALAEDSEQSSSGKENNDDISAPNQGTEVVKKEPRVLSDESSSPDHSNNESSSGDLTENNHDDDDNGKVDNKFATRIGISLGLISFGVGLTATARIWKIRRDRRHENGQTAAARQNAIARRNQFCARNNNYGSIGNWGSTTMTSSVISRTSSAATPPGALGPVLQGVVVQKPLHAGSIVSNGEKPVGILKSSAGGSAKKAGNVSGKKSGSGARGLQGDNSTRRGLQGQNSTGSIEPVDGSTIELSSVTIQGADINPTVPSSPVSSHSSFDVHVSDVGDMTTVQKGKGQKKEDVAVTK